MTRRIVDDTALTYTLNPGKKTGIVRVFVGEPAIAPGNARQAEFFFNAGTSPTCEKSVAYPSMGAHMVASTSTLSGTTGTDGRITVSAHDGVLQVENRIGTDQFVTVEVS